MEWHSSSRPFAAISKHETETALQSTIQTNEKLIENLSIGKT
jgi:hypothetical protein